MLRYFGIIKGIPEAEIDSIVENMIDKLGKVKLI